MEVKKIVERKRAKHANWKASQLLEAKGEVKRKSRQKSKTNLNVDSQNGKRVWRKMNVFVVPWFLVVYHFPTLRFF
jgi:hypothetical protein